MLPGCNPFGEWMQRQSFYSQIGPPGQLLRTSVIEFRLNHDKPIIIISEYLKHYALFSRLHRILHNIHDLQRIRDAFLLYF